MSLPTSNEAKKPGAQQNPPLVVSIDKNGQLHFGEDDEVVTPQQLRTRLLAKIESLRKANKEVRLAIRADKQAPWFRIVYVMDLAKEAKVNSLNAFTKEVKSK